MTLNSEIVKTYEDGCEIERQWVADDDGEMIKDSELYFIYDENGCPLSRSFKTRNEAEAWLN